MVLPFIRQTRCDCKTVLLLTKSDFIINTGQGIDATRCC